MRGYVYLSILIASLSVCVSAQEDTYRIVGYFTSWSVYGRNYYITDIPAEKVTHINLCLRKHIFGWSDRSWRCICRYR
jgi:hypothetical protein